GGYIVGVMLKLDMYSALCFFFSSRRRHTRSKRDWSSDVCSSDLPSDNVDSGDVDDVVTVNLLFLVHGGWLSGSLSHGPEHFLLQVTTDVATSTSLFVGHVEVAHLQAGERTLGDAGENTVDPFLGATNCLRLLAIDEVSFWE